MDSTPGTDYGNVTGADDQTILPAGSTFRWESGAFLATTNELFDGSNAVTDALAGRGLAVAGGASGGGSIVPWPAHYAGNVRLTSPMTEKAARSMIEDAFRSTFTFVASVTSAWHGLSTVASDTASNLADDAAKVEAGAFPWAILIVVALVSVTALYGISTVRKFT